MLENLLFLPTLFSVPALYYCRLQHLWLLWISWIILKKCPVTQQTQLKSSETNLSCWCCYDLNTIIKKNVKFVSLIFEILADFSRDWSDFDSAILSFRSRLVNYGDGPSQKGGAWLLFLYRLFKSKHNKVNDKCSWNILYIAVS